MSIRVNSDFEVLAENELLLLGCVWESIWLIEKATLSETHLGNLDAMVDFGAVGPQGDWAITGREVILLWKNGDVKIFDRPELKCLENVTVLDQHSVRLHIDASNLNRNKALWHLSMETAALTKE
jgi:hypothetical protein